MKRREPMGQKTWVEAMRQEWDARAREKARYYIATDVADTEEDFFASGKADYENFVRPFLVSHGFKPQGKTAVEIGCGIGRMSRAFAEEFGEVVGVDVSPEMVEGARARGWTNARFVNGNGTDLGGIGDESADFVFSFIVFQHIPMKEAILRYVEETGRVLRPGGMFRMHMNGLPHVEIGGMVLEGYISESPRLSRLPLKRFPFVRQRRLGTWLGYPISLADIRKACERGGLQLTEVQGRWTENMWVGGRKVG